MALLHLVLFFVAVLTAVAQPAAETRARQPVEIRFVPPGSSGTVSLGIYDSSEKLVRILCEEWTFNRFQTGLDGLMTTWDGMSGDGHPVPPGVYRARGFVVGDIKVSGEALHFNDWIENADSPRIVSAAACQPLPGGDVLIAARLSGALGALIRYSPASEVRWRTTVSEARPVPAAEVGLVASSTMAFLLLDGKLRAADLQSGAEALVPASWQDAQAVAARGDRLALLQNGIVRLSGLPDFSPCGEITACPSEIVSLALLGDGAVAAARDGTVWRWAKAWTRIDTPDNTRVRAVSSGIGDTFWALEERENGSTSVVLCSPTDGRLAEWIPGPEDGEAVSVAGSTEADFFVVGLAAPGIQRTVGIRRTEDGKGWQFVFDKKITASSSFGQRDGRLVSSSDEVPVEAKINLMENPLDPAAPRDLVVRAVSDGSGTGLSSADSLPLLRVADQPGFERVMLVKESEPGSARFYQGDGSCVEEYKLGNLGSIVSFDAGSVELNASGEVVRTSADEEAPPVAP